MSKDDKWIQKTGIDKPGHKGALRKKMHKKPGEKITVAELHKKEHSRDPKTRKQAYMAENLKRISAHRKGK